jgi:hypothetical protein
VKFWALTTIVTIAPLVVSIAIGAWFFFLLAVPLVLVAAGWVAHGSMASRGHPAPATQVPDRLGRV